MCKHEFFCKSGYDRVFQQVTLKGGDSETKFIHRFQNAQAFSVSAGENYYEDQLMHILLYNFHQGGKYSAQIASHHAELRREENFTDKKFLSISYLQNDYLNLDSSSGFGKNSERENIVKTK